MGEDRQPTSEAETTRYIVWLVAGLAFLGYGFAALYQLYTAAPPAGVGTLPLSVALVCTAAGGYVLLAVFFNLWLPKPKIDRIRRHRKVSIATAFALLVAAGLVGTQFPRKPGTVARVARSPIRPHSATASPHALRTLTPSTRAAVPSLTPHVIAPHVDKALPPHATTSVTVKATQRPTAARVHLAVASPNISHTARPKSRPVATPKSIRYQDENGNQKNS